MMCVCRAVFFLFFLSINYAFANTNTNTNTDTCKSKESADDNKTTFCFFSLNNPQEKITLEERYKDNPNIEVKEFYGKANPSEPVKSVKDQFKAMLQTSECDSLVISGHHTGYFSGEQTGKILDLDFIENMSCEPGCGEWFSNVESLFLMGCQTVKDEKRLRESQTADQESIRVSKGSDYEITSNDIHHITNQAFSSTLAKNNKLSHRYLRMFPNSSLYGWGAMAPSAIFNSDQSLPNFIDLVSKLHTAGTNGDDTEDILNFVNFINNDSHRNCHQYLSARAWTKHWTNDQNDRYPTACYIKTDTDGTGTRDEPTKEKLAEYQKLGCDLKSALKSKTAEDDITQAINNIFQSGPQAIEANFNRLMSLITNTDNKNESWYSQVINQLRRNEKLKEVVIAGIESPETGFARKSDYLYFYQEMGWTDKPEALSQNFLRQLSTTFHQSVAKTGEDSSVTKSLHLSLIQSIYDNNLQNWLSQKSPQEFNQLVGNYTKAYSGTTDGVNGLINFYVNEITGLL